ncbi:MAG: translation initiation factor IF-2 [Clostridia bacterium]|nr:translation initiation factor IF-2 [Clostridia bacterium]
MMIKYRVHEVAKDFGETNNKKVIEILSKYTGETKKHMTALTEEELNIVFDAFTQSTAVESFDAFFKMGEEAKAAKKAEKEAKKADMLAQQALIAEMLKNGGKMPEAAPAQAEQKEEKETKAKKADKPAKKEEKAAPHKESKPIPPQKKEKKEPGAQPNRGPGTLRTVDTRANNVDLEKYNEKYTNLAPDRAMRDTSSNKQKLNQRSKDYRRNQRSKAEKEAAELRRIQLEKIKATPIKVTVGEEITVSELASRMKKTAAEVIKELMKLGVMATMNQVIDYDTAEIVATEMGAVVEKEVVITIEDRIIDDHEDTAEDLKPRDPVVVVMGHVDHGKTSLLDAIRNTRVTAGEAGGITQHIGAYRVTLEDRDITFLDTPGHAAFTAMRARGAMATDVAILVVAADDGIMPQTIEAINHARAAEVQIVVAINKMDKESANPDRIMQQLTEHNLVPEEWGGDVICVPVSAHTGMNIDKLLESVLLVSDMLELKANPDRAAKGVVIEARLDKGRGPVATVLVQNGTLKSGDILVAGSAVGRVRVMTNDKGERVKEAGPSVPVEITGMAEVPEAGDEFNAVSDERLARELVEQRKAAAKEEQFRSQQKVTLDNLFDQMQQGDMKELNIVVKADVQGSVEAVRQSLEKLTNDEVRVRVIHGGAGAISESDVMLANASNAIVVGFNVRPDPVAQANAERDGVELRMYRVIYDCIEEIEAAMKGMLAPKFREVVMGRIEVRNVFKISSAGTIAGSYVLNGKVTRACQIRVVRDGIVIAEDAIDSLRRFKDDVKEVASGYECGIGLEKFSDIKEGDIFEAFIMEEYRD